MAGHAVQSDRNVRQISTSVLKLQQPYSTTITFSRRTVLVVDEID